MIPKRIYYVWIGDKPLGNAEKNNIKSWKKNNPDFDIIKVDEKNFDINRFTFIKCAYESRNWAFASDLIRLVVIYQNGGFYFDTDAKLLKPLDRFCKYKSVWGMEAPGFVNSGLIIGASKKDDDLSNLIDIYSQINFDPKNIYEFVTTGIISKYFWSKGLKRANKMQIMPNRSRIFPSQYFAPFHWWGGGHISKETVAVQQFTSNWGNEPRDIGKMRKFSLDFYFHCPRLWMKLSKIKNSL